MLFRSLGHPIQRRRLLEWIHEKRQAQQNGFLSCVAQIVEDQVGMGESPAIAAARDLRIKLEMDYQVLDDPDPESFPPPAQPFPPPRSDPRRLGQVRRSPRPPPHLPPPLSPTRA